MGATDTVAARTVALIVIMIGLLYYHFYFYYLVQSSVFGSVRSSLQNLWTSKILPANADYFSTNLVGTIQALDSYNTVIHPVVQNSLSLIGNDESSCNKGIGYFGIGVEIISVLGLIAFLLMSVRTVSYLPTD